MSPAQSWKNTAPESFRANAQAISGTGGVAAAMTFQVDAYTPDADRERLLAALTSGGSPAFVAALKKEKAAGYVQAGDRKVTIRYARMQPAADGKRRVVLVTDAPVLVGGGALDAAPKEDTTSPSWSSRSIPWASGAARWRWRRASKRAAPPASRSTTTRRNPSSW
jgi:hypothetical protein